MPSITALRMQPPAKRPGKSPAGHITLEARPDGDQIVIAVSDDGRGLDLAKIRQAAKLKGLMSDAAIDELDDEAATNLIFMPGFSTADSVTNISGRGIGMDVVRAAVASLGGRVSMTSTPGAGTTVQMMLPQAVLVSTVVMVASGEDRFGVPIEAVSGNLPDISRSHLTHSQWRGLRFARSHPSAAAAISHAATAGLSATRCRCESADRQIREPKRRR